LHDATQLPDDNSSFDLTGSNFYDDRLVTLDESGDGNEGVGRNDVPEMSAEEKDDVMQLFSFETSYLDNNEGAIFSISDQTRLREHELAMMNSNKEGYYCCKIKHAKVYEKMNFQFGTIPCILDDGYVAA